ncbi:SDR family NAD(P)-dependent oxidoreductase [Arthrobacter sp. H41]|uniref:SDR family NAD(P)-dependent oxidoreductase n=1 Tax=Arthrobacter sp. H41 TaxID=1312978 RepID=UPI0004B33C50|nr:SDR family NAD(P)-dependent oxidoreductase [Arthrobacter sp. H41]
MTGGGRGIGAAISRRLGSDGHDLVIGYHRDEASARSTAADVLGAGGRAWVAQVDTVDEASVADFFRFAEGRGEVTGLVNNAGSVSAVGRLQDNAVEAIRQDLDTTLLGTILCSKYAIGPMKRAGTGSIVNISSSAATLGSPGTYVHYAAAKAGIDALTIGLAKELATENIRVNAVAPGTVWTDFHQDPDRPAKVATTIPMGRAGQPDEIAGAVAWLFSEDAAYTTGANIRVAGGL